jgi:hypothetical protein
MTPPKSPRNRPRLYLRSGFYEAKRALETYGERLLPGPDTPLGRALHDWRASLIDDLGGEDAISTQQRAVIDAAVRTKLLLDSVDAFVLGMDSPVNKSKRALFGIVKDRQGLADALVRYMKDLGLERRQRDVADLATYLAEKAAAQEREAAVPTEPLEEPDGDDPGR